MASTIDLNTLSTPQLQTYIAELEQLLAAARHEQNSRRLATPDRPTNNPDYSPNSTEEQLAREDLDSPISDYYLGDSGSDTSYHGTKL
jgi:hypothetical protein